MGDPTGNLLSNVSPAALKRYGIYAILSFFISISVILAYDSIKTRDSDIRYERSQKESLQKILDEQTRLRVEQELLLRQTIYIHTRDSLNKSK